LALNIKKGKYWFYLKNKDRTKNVMDKIWDRNPSKLEFIGRCDGDEKTEWPRRTDKKANAKKISTTSADRMLGC